VNTQNIPHGSQEYKVGASKPQLQPQLHCKPRPKKGAKNCAYIYHLMNIPQSVSSIGVWIAPGPSVAIDGQTQFKKKEKESGKFAFVSTTRESDFSHTKRCNS
jgi:hypothetical protein